MAKTICNILIKNGLDLGNIAFQSYDFASNMSGHLRGTQAMVSEIVGHNIPYIPCQAHRLNTFVEHSCNASIIVGELFNTLESLYVFFSSSTKRSSFLEKKLADIEKSLKLRNLSKTRWTARAESLRAVWISFEGISNALKEIYIDKTIDKNTRIQALGLEKKILSFDFIVGMYTMKIIMYQMKTLTEQLEAINLNIIDGIILIDCAIKSLTEIRSDTDQLNKHISSAKVFASKMNVDPEIDFQRHHRKRFKPKRIDENNSSQVDFSLDSFYRHEFNKVLDTLINLMSGNLSSCLSSIKPLYDILSVPLNSNITTYDLKNAFTLFPPSYDISHVTDYDGVLCEINILRHQTNKCSSLQEVMELSNKLKSVIPLANSLCKLAYTSPVSSASNERVFSNLKLIKNHLRTTMTNERLDDLIILNTAKDILGTIDLDSLVVNWSTLKERRILI